MISRSVVALGLLSLAACATAQQPASHAKPGFVTEVKDGLLWVYAKDIDDYLAAK